MYNIHYNFNNYPSNIVELEYIGQMYNIEITEGQVWEVAKKSNTIPSMENIYMALIMLKKVL